MVCKICRAGSRGRETVRSPLISAKRWKAIMWAAKLLFLREQINVRFRHGWPPLRWPFLWLFYCLWQKYGEASDIKLLALNIEL